MKTPDSLAIDARKIVRGEEQGMGVLTCRLMSPNGQTQCTMPQGVWHFSVRRDSLVGELRLSDNTRYRDVRAITRALASPPASGRAPSRAASSHRTFADARLVTLGGVALADEDGPLGGPLVQRRRLALLARIAAAGQRGVSRDSLAALLWPDSDEERARHTLRQWLSLLRRDLKAENLLLGTAELRLNPQVITSDVGELREALGRGELEVSRRCTRAHSSTAST